MKRIFGLNKILLLPLIAGIITGCSALPSIKTYSGAEPSINDIARIKVLAMPWGNVPPSEVYLNNKKISSNSTPYNYLIKLMPGKHHIKWTMNLNNKTTHTKDGFFNAEAANYYQIFTLPILRFDKQVNKHGYTYKQYDVKGFYSYLYDFTNCKTLFGEKPKKNTLFMGYSVITECIKEDESKW